MKIPESVRIAGIEYDIEHVENLRHGYQIALGHISYDSCSIQLSANDITGHECKCVVLWHEIIHCIIDNASLQIPEDDLKKTVDILARGVYQVLQDNGRRLFDIVPNTNEKEI